MLARLESRQPPLRLSWLRPCSGRLVEAVANSPYAADTLIIITEDDVQDGPDHVDSHRGTAFVAGPYVKKGAVISARYSQVNVLRTIEDILGTEHINLNTAFQSPMEDVFDVASSGDWTYTADVSTVLDSTSLALAEHGQPIRFAADRASHPYTTPPIGTQGPPASTSRAPTRCRRRSSTVSCGKDSTETGRTRFGGTRSPFGNARTA